MSAHQDAPHPPLTAPIHNHTRNPGSHRRRSSLHWDHRRPLTPLRLGFRPPATHPPTQPRLPRSTSTAAAARYLVGAIAASAKSTKLRLGPFGLWSLSVRFGGSWPCNTTQHSCPQSRVHTQSYPRRGHRQLASVSQQQRSSSQLELLASRRARVVLPARPASPATRAERVAKSPESQPPTKGCCCCCCCSSSSPLSFTERFPFCLCWRSPLTLAWGKPSISHSPPAAQATIIISLSLFHLTSFSSRVEKARPPPSLRHSVTPSPPPPLHTYTHCTHRIRESCRLVTLFLTLSRWIIRNFTILLQAASPSTFGYSTG